MNVRVSVLRRIHCIARETSRTSRIRRRNLDDRRGAVTHGGYGFRDIVGIGDHENGQIALQLARFLQEFIDGSSRRSSAMTRQPASLERVCASADSSEVGQMTLVNPRSARRLREFARRIARQQ
jgi:hypothetical protein